MIITLRRNSRASSADRLLTGELIRMGRKLKVTVIGNGIIMEGGIQFAEQGEMTGLLNKQIMWASTEMNTSSFRRIKMKREIKRRFV